jgi:hypothetical protein
MGKPRSQNTRQKAVQWKDMEEKKNNHPNHPVSHSIIPQSSNNPFTTHNHTTMPAFFQQAPPPPPPPHYFPQAQMPCNLYHTNYLGIAPYQQHIKGTPIQTLHQNPIQGNTQNPFQPLVQTQNNLMYYNPFGTSQTLHPQSQNKYNISLEKNGSKKKKVLYQEAYSLSSHSQKVATSINNTKLQCLMAYGFYANPKFTLQKNFNNMLNNSVAPPQYLQPKNLAFHNLCKLNKLPTGSKVLLGLNLKFCLANKMITNDISKTMLHMARSIPNKSSSKKEWSYR